MVEAGSLARFNFKETFISLKYPNFRLWFIGQLVSLVGTWMQSAAQGYLVYELTKSPAFLGYVSAANGIPSWIFTLYAGAIADRMPRRTLMVITQSAMMVLAFILAALAFTHLVQPWHIIVLAFMLGICNAFDAPARQAFVLEMVDREVLTNAIALNSTMFTSAIVIGPAVGGLAYAWVGPEWCFTLNGLSFVAVIIALLMMKLKPMPHMARKPVSFRDIADGLVYVARDSTLRLLIANLGVTTIFGLGIATLIPAWAVNIWHWLVDRRADDRGAGPAQHSRSPVDLRQLRLTHLLVDLRRHALAAAVTRSDGRHRLGFCDDQQRLECPGSDSHCGRNARPGDGHLHAGLLRLDADRLLPGGERRRSAGRTAHRGDQRFDPDRLCVSGAVAH
jgi:hypothetical protein